MEQLSAIGWEMFWLARSSRIVSPASPSCAVTMFDALLKGVLICPDDPLAMHERAQLAGAAYMPDH